jgi:hypothetical protein
LISGLPEYYNTLEQISLFSFNNSYYTTGSSTPVNK